MNTLTRTFSGPQAALIYCRVPSTKQKLEGGGLDSQEHRCRAYAAERGFDVEMVFPDDVTGGGDYMKRPGMRAMLAYMDAQPGKCYTISFDDLKRLARDTEYHIKLRRELAQRGAAVESPNFRFENTPEGKFIETMFAAQGELEREQNRRQVIQKMKARVEAGYWVFRVPVGYRYVSGKGHGGKVLVLDDSLASVVREALEGFASGRFASQAEVMRFLENDPYFPKDRKDGSLRPMTVTRLLRKVVYAGYVEAPAWGGRARRPARGADRLPNPSAHSGQSGRRQTAASLTQGLQRGFPAAGVCAVRLLRQGDDGGMVKGQDAALCLLPLRDAGL